MRTFAQVVDDGGFAAAARTLDLSPAVVTRLVGDLEAHLNTRLLQRTTRRMALTEAGEAYLARLRPVLADIAEADAALQSQAGQMSGLIRVLSQPAIAVNLLAPLIGEFRQLHPKVALDLHVREGVEAFVQEFDLTLLVTEADFDADLIARKIAETEGVVCAAPTYLKRRGEPRVPEDLAAHECLTLKHPLRAGRADSWRLSDGRAGGRAVSVTVPLTLSSNHLDFLLRAALEGAGIAALPIHLAARFLERGELVRVLQDWRIGHAVVYAALPSRKFLPARTRALLDFLIDRTQIMLAAVDAAERD